MDGADGAAVHLHPPVPPQRPRGQGARRAARPGAAPQRGLRGRRGHRRVRDVMSCLPCYNDSTFLIFYSLSYILFILLKISSLNLNKQLYMLPKSYQ